MKLISPSALLLLALAAGAAAPLYGAPRVITKDEKIAIKKMEKKKKEESKDKKKIARENKKRAAALKKDLAKITPIPTPVVKVEEAELEALQKAAAEGDAAAMVRLGHYHMLHEQAGHQKTAGEFFRRAAENDPADATAWLAVYEYITSTGGEKDVSRLKCYNKAKGAEENGSAMGAFIAALMSEDSAEKLELYTKSAHQGFVPAMRALGELRAREAYENQATRYDPMPEDARLWLELAYRQGDAQAAYVRAGSNHMHRITGEEYSTDATEVEKWLRNALELVLKRERTWYGDIFERLSPSPHIYAWGGDRMTLILRIFSGLQRTREFDHRNAADVGRECCNTLKKLAAADDIEAMAAAIMLSRKWSFWMGLNVANPGILKESDWMPKLKQKAANGNARAARLLKECNMVSK